MLNQLVVIFFTGYQPYPRVAKTGLAAGTYTDTYIYTHRERGVRGKETGREKERRVDELVFQHNVKVARGTAKKKKRKETDDRFCPERGYLYNYKFRILGSIQHIYNDFF
jgi:hypothetical protein